MKFKDPCFYCKRDMRKVGKTDDHITPLSKGGKNKGNIVRCCPDCNQFKANKDLPEWMDQVQTCIDSRLNYKVFTTKEFIQIKKAITILMQPKAKIKKSKVKESLMVQLKSVLTS